MSASVPNSNPLPASIAPNDCNVPYAGNDGISSLAWSPTANLLVSTNWDSGIRCWEVQEQGGQIEAIPKAKVDHENAVLDCCFSTDGSTVFSGGADKAVRMWKLGETPPNTIAPKIGIHNAPVKSVGFLPSSRLVVSGGWDKKLKFWDTRSPSAVARFVLPERVYDLDVRGNLMVVATADRQIIIYNVGGAEPIEYERQVSPLRYQSRCVACLPDQTGFAVGCIGGRVKVQYGKEVNGKGSYGFKCHRQESDVYSVNALAFHNATGTLATAGSDGTVGFWNLDRKRKVKLFNAIQRPIPCVAFNAQGNLFAYASSYDWSKGSSHYAPTEQGNEIFVHCSTDAELQPEPKTS